MNLLPTKIFSDIISSDELTTLDSLIRSFNDIRIYSHDHGKYANQHIASFHKFPYYEDAAEPIRQILEPLFLKTIGKLPLIDNCHILDAHLPYLLHTDLTTKNRIPGTSPAYSMLIPLQTSECKTIIFNEYSLHDIEFEPYIENYVGQPTMTLDKEFCNKYLSHLHPSVLKYLSLQTVYDWSAGSMVMFDARYFHCSSNFIKQGYNNKQAVMLWSYVE
jgi:hypothetical protein